MNATMPPILDPSDVVTEFSDGRRRLAARGTVINSIFLAGIGTLNLVRSVIVAGFLTAAEFGVWSIVFLTLIFAVSLKAVAVGNKYIQQDESDQEQAFQKALTLEFISAGILLIAMLAVMPLLTLAYGRGDLLLPGMAIALMVPGLALQAPVWVYHRQMDFLRQRLLLSVDPVVGFIVTVAVAVAGAGYWSLVAGVVVGAWIGGLAAVAASPYPLKFRYEQGTTREYVAFSGPLLVAVAAGLLVAQLSVFFGELRLGLAGAGAIGLAATFSAYTDRIDTVITDALYPAVCRVRDRADLLFEAFTKSNRLALMWGFPFGVGLCLFASDLVEFGIGEQWRDAVVLLQVFGVTAAVNHIGFNWGVFYRAIGRTRPIAVVTVAALGGFLVAAIPLLFAYGLAGFAAGMAVATAVSLAARWYYLAKLFPSLKIAVHSARAIAPTLPATATVIVLRLTLGGDRSIEAALGELAVYALVTALATLLLERRLIGEMISYLRRAPDPTPG